MMTNEQVILEQYESFVNENKAILEEQKAEALKDLSFRTEYIKALAEAIEDKDARGAFEKVAQREVELLLSESSLLLTEAEQAWALMYFPILADVYQTPTISKLLTVFTTSQARVAIPKKVVKGEIIALDGTKTEVTLPSTDAVRPGKVVQTISEGKTNLFDAIGLSGVKAKINQRYFGITKLSLTDNDGSNNHAVNLDVTIRPDFSGNFSGEATFAAKGDGKPVTVFISGSVNFKTGDIILNKSIVTSSKDTITFNNATVECRVNVYGADLGKVKLTLDVENKYELQIDEDNSFFIELVDEQVQDFKDIYNVDILANLLDVVKLQFVLNKDADVADLLRLTEPDMGGAGTVDFSTLPSNLAPANVSDVYSIVVPKILAVAKAIKRIAHVEPQYIVANGNTAVVLETLQGFATQYANGSAKNVGPVSQAIQFSKFQIVESNAVDPNKIYLVYKANVKSAAALVDVVYKPLYVHKSDVNGVAKQYLKSRTAVEVVDPRKLGVVTIANNPFA